MKNKFVWLVILSCGLVVHYANASYRGKRIVFGKPVSDRKGFLDSVLYFVWIGQGFGCDSWLKRFGHYLGNLKSCRPSLNEQLCGGALLTSTIVQTAAHCIADNKGVIVNNTWVQGVVRNNWEATLELFAGYNDIADMERGVNSKRLYIHQHFGMLTEKQKLFKHDFGFIVLAEEATSVNEWVGLTITYAPFYPLRSLYRIWTDIFRKQAACLYVGFGYYQNYKAVSSVLRYGWQMIQDYKSCYAFTYLWRKHRVSFNYTRDGTWACSRPFGSRQEHAAMGDSGSPVTCNGFFFAAVSAGLTTVLFNNSYVSISTPVAYAPYEMAAEYRKSFVQTIDQYLTAWRPEHYPRPPITAFPTFYPTKVEYTLSAYNSKPQMHSDILLLCFSLLIKSIMLFW